MRGDDRQPDAMFSYVSAEQRVPPDHRLRTIRTLVDDVPPTVFTKNRNRLNQEIARGFVRRVVEACDGLDV